MERQIVGMYIRANHDGTIDTEIGYYDILKETPKTVKPVRRGVDSVINCRVIIRKDELGEIKRNYASAYMFEISATNIFSDEKEVEAGFHKLMQLFEAELESRFNIMKQWKANFSIRKNGED